MTNLRMVLVKTIITAGLFVSVFCSPPPSDTSLIYVASTPADEPLRSILAIPAEAKIDFMRWKLELHASGAFTLNLMYGVGKPNTLGFYDTTVKSYAGRYTIGEGQHPVYHLKGNGMSNELMLARINENIFHILTRDQQLMIGNGGWSYTLNAVNPVQITPELNSFIIPAEDTARKMVFDGRTPCKEFARDHDIRVERSCFKFKWRLILNRDPETLEPTTYSTRRIVYDISDNTGKWAIRKTASGAVIIQLNPDQPERSISLLMLDNNILYFLDKNGQPYTGNADFSFVLNRIQ